MAGTEETSTRYKQYLPPNFFCGVVFFDLYEQDASNKSILNQFAENQTLRGLFGGMVLRGEGHTKPMTGRIMLTQSETSYSSFKSKDKAQILKLGLSDPIRITDNLYRGAILLWAEANFATFAFDILAMLKGQYEVGRASSFYGMGSSDLELGE